MSDTQFDLIVIGSGPAGYVAALRAAQLGMKTACIDKRKAFGGTCLNVGCIPSKALLDSSEHFFHLQARLQKHGISVDTPKLDLAQMMRRKDAIVRQFSQGVAGLFKKNRVTGFQGTATLLPKEGQGLVHRVQVQSEAGHTVLTAPKVLLATGSEPVELPFLPWDKQFVLSSTEALELTEVPSHLVVVGGGVIGLELGSVWLRLGAQVTVVEFQDRICSSMDHGLSQELLKNLKKQGMQFQLGTQCLGMNLRDGKPILSLKNRSTQETSELACDRILVATGRRPYTAQLGLASVSLNTDPAGRMPVNAHYETEVSGIYAIGDLIAGPMLAHKAEDEGVAVAEILAGQAGHVNYATIPSVIYTWPEVASVGASEEELKTQGVAYRAGSFPFHVNGRARAMEATAGWVKILADEKTDRLLGMHIIGPWASDLITEGVSVMEFGGSAEDIARTCHAHPTLSEAVKEAALAVHQRPLHL